MIGKLSVSLEQIKKLESPSGWVTWKRDITDALGIGGYKDLLGRNKDAPAAVGLTPEVHYTRQELWMSRQETACSIVLKCCGYNAATLLQATQADGTPKVEERLHLYLETLEKRYQPTGSAILQSLDASYLETTLAECKGGVSEYAERLRKARSELEQLDPDLVIPEPLFVNRFLRGLGPNFTTFLTSFCQMNSLLPVRNTAGIITTEGVTFDTAVMSAEADEANQRLQNTAPTALVVRHQEKGRSSGPPPTTTCNHCKKPYHVEANCWTKHPEKEAPAKAARKKAREALKLALNDRYSANNSDNLGTTAAVTFCAPTNLPSGSDTGYVPPTECGVHMFPVMNSIVAAAAAGGPLVNNWILDNGANQHVSCHQGFFAPGTLRPYKGSAVTGYGNKQHPTKVGTAIILCLSGTKVIYLALSNCLFDPKAGCNLISYSQLKKAGASYKLVDNGFEIITQDGPIHAKEVHGLYWLPLARDSLAVKGKIPGTALAAYSIKES
jgi:hypothetical protein